MICRTISGLMGLAAIVVLGGCARPMPNDPAPSAEAAEKIRVTLVSNSTTASSGGAESAGG